MEEMIVLAVVLAIGSIVQIKYKEHLFHSWRERIFATAVFFLVMISWEFYSTSHGIWIFPGEGMIGFNIFGLPLELYLFYIIVPYFTYVFYEAIHIWFDKKKRKINRSS